MLETWQQLLASPDLIAAASDIEAFDAAAITRLRRDHPTELVRAAVELVTARRKAADKFPQLAERIVADVAGVEQSSSLDVAAHKAGRFAQLGLPAVADLCCGIGGDAMALAAHAEARLFDMNPVKAWMARQNVHAATGRWCDAAAVDVTTLDPRRLPAFHIDPDRRAAGRRLQSFADYQPGPGFIAALIAGCPDGAVKLGPGVDLASLPPGEVELISRRGTLVQAVLWTGRLRRAARTATLIDAAGVHTLAGRPADVPVDEPGRFILAVDPAIERAELLGNLCERLGVAAVHPQLGLVTANSIIHSPWLTPFELLERMPWRVRKVRQWLAAHDGGIVEVKTRGKAVDPDVAARQLRGDGGVTFTVFVLRFDRQVEAWMTRRPGR